MRGLETGRFCELIHEFVLDAACATHTITNRRAATREPWPVVSDMPQQDTVLSKRIKHNHKRHVCRWARGFYSSPMPPFSSPERYPAHTCAAQHVSLV